MRRLTDGYIAVETRVTPRLDWSLFRGGSVASPKNEITDPGAIYSGSPGNRYHLSRFRVVLVKTPDTVQGSSPAPSPP